MSPRRPHDPDLHRRREVAAFLSKSITLARELFDARLGRDILPALEAAERRIEAYEDGGDADRSLILLAGLPSPSRRNTMPYAKKVRAYRRAFRGAEP